MANKTDKFPALLWISEPNTLMPNDPFEGHVDWKAAESGDELAEYKLVRVVRVHEKKEKFLVDLSGGK